MNTPTDLSIIGKEEGNLQISEDLDPIRDQEMYDHVLNKGRLRTWSVDTIANTAQMDIIYVLERLKTDVTNRIKTTKSNTNKEILTNLFTSTENISHAYYQKGIEYAKKWIDAEKQAISITDSVEESKNKSLQKKMAKLAYKWFCNAANINPEINEYPNEEIKKFIRKNVQEAIQIEAE